MIDRPRLKGFVTVFPIADELWGLQGGREELWRIQLRGKEALSIFSALLPHLDGQRTVDEILAELEAQGLRPQPARALLQRLEGNGLLEEGGYKALSDEQRSRYFDQLNFFSHFSSRADDLQASLHSARVAVVGTSRLSFMIATLLEEAGVGTVDLLETDSAYASTAAAPRRVPEDAASNRAPDRYQRPDSVIQDGSFDAETLVRGGDGGDGPGFVVVTRESHSTRILEAVNQLSLERDAPWLLVEALSAKEGTVGPLFVPGQTACFACMESRLRSNLLYDDEYLALQHHLGNGHPPPPTCGALHPFQQTLAGIAACEVVKFLTSIKTPQLAGKALTLDLFNWNAELHDILRVPRCPVCRPPAPEPFAWRALPYEKRS